MKKNIILSLTLLLVFASCRKQDNPNLPAGLARVPQVIVTIDPNGSQAIDLLNLNSFSAKFTVDMYFPNDIPPAKLDIVVIKNGDKTNIKTYKSNVTTWPVTYTLAISDLNSLFPGGVALGDTYTFGVDITTQDGTTFQAFPAIASAYGSYVNSYPTKTPGTLTNGVITGGGPGIATTATFGAICAYDPTIYQGTFLVVSDAFQDLNPGDKVTLAKLTNNSFSFTYPDAAIAPFPPPAIAVVVNTANNNISVASQVIGTKIYGVYDNPTVAASSGSVTPCSQTVTINLLWTVKQGSFGVNPLVLKKQ